MITAIIEMTTPERHAMRAVSTINRDAATAAGLHRIAAFWNSAMCAIAEVADNERAVLASAFDHLVAEREDDDPDEAV